MTVTLHRPACQWIVRKRVSQDGRGRIDIGMARPSNAHRHRPSTCCSRFFRAHIHDGTAGSASRMFVGRPRCGERSHIRRGAGRVQCVASWVHASRDGRCRRIRSRLRWEARRIRWAAAVVALRHSKLHTVVLEDHSAVLRLLATRHHDVVAHRTRVIYRLHTVLCLLVAGGLPRQLSAATAAAELRRIRPTDQIGIERCQLRRVPLGRSGAAGRRREEGPHPPRGPSVSQSVRTSVQLPELESFDPASLNLPLTWSFRNTTATITAERDQHDEEDVLHHRSTTLVLGELRFQPRTQHEQVHGSLHAFHRGQQLSPARRGNGVGRRGLCIGLGPISVDPDLRRLRRESRTLPFSAEWSRPIEP